MKRSPPAIKKPDSYSSVVYPIPAFSNTPSPQGHLLNKDLYIKIPLKERPPALQIKDLHFLPKDLAHGHPINKLLGYIHSDVFNRYNAISFHNELHRIKRIGIYKLLSI